MPKRIFKYYNIASSESIEFGDWTDVNGNKASEENKLNQSWDPYNTLSFNRNIKISIDEFKNSTSLKENDECRIISTWYSSGTSLKNADKKEGNFLDFKINKENINCNISLKIDGSLIGEKLVISTNICLLKNNSNSAVAANSQGSILWQDRQEILLEGHGSLFPVEVNSFPKSYSNANWYLSIGEMTASISGGLRLYINGDKENLINDINSVENNGEISKIIYADIARLIVLKSIHDPEFRKNTLIKNETYSDNTVGKCAYDLIKLYLKKSPNEIYEQYIFDPLAFERDIQHKFSDL